MKFHVLTAESMKMMTFWDTVQCSLVETDHVSEVRSASIIAVKFRQYTSVYINGITRRYIPEAIIFLTLIT
jgi:hypothetical protein